MTYQIEPGTVIAGTLRSEDLLEAFSNELDGLWTKRVGGNSVDKNIVRIYEEACMFSANIEQMESIDPSGEVASRIVNELQDALNEYAPEGMYFGTLEGDGADFGWWYVESEVTA
jgi:hypothetical protein